MKTKIPLLFAIDPGGCAIDVAETAASLAEDLGTPVTLVTVAQLPQGVAADAEVREGPFEGLSALEVLRLDGFDALESMKAPFVARQIPVTMEVLEGEPVHALVERAKTARMVVVGTHGRRGLKRFFLGSVAEGIVRRSSVPVLTVRSTQFDERGQVARRALAALAVEP